MTPRLPWRLLLTGPGEAAWNMALDEVLLQGAASRPTLRLYRWSPPAFSLGRFQDSLPRGAPADAPWVRRITGGGTIYHYEEITFSLACPSSKGPLQGGRMDAYEAVNRSIQIALGAIGVEVSRWEGQAAGDSGFCFETRSRTDLLHRGRKLVGSAQRRKRGRLLLHGSLPLEPNPFAPSSISLREAASRGVSVAEAEEILMGGFEEGLGICLVPGVLTPAEVEAALRRQEALMAGTVAASRG